MSENPKDSNSNVFTALFIAMFVCLALFMGHKQMNTTLVADNNDENSEVVVIDESN